LFPRIFRPNGP